MNKEVTLEQIISNIILFFDRNKKLILSITFTGVLIVVLFQKLKPSYYATSAIVQSGISAYERFPDDPEEDIFNQRTAINIINDLGNDIEKEDYNALANKLDIKYDQAAKIKFIEAEPLLRQDKDEKFHNTPKFQINLVVRDNTIIDIIQKGIVYYFQSNEYINRYKEQYNSSNQALVDSINQEIAELKRLRKEGSSNIDMSTNRILSSKEKTETDNVIMSLEESIHIINTHDMLMPIDFVTDFTVTEIAEREVVVWGTAVGILSFFLSLFIALIREVKSKYQKS